MRWERDRQALEARAIDAEQLVVKTHQRLEAVFGVSQEFLEASDENEVVGPVLQLLVELAGAKGATFVPLDEHGQPQAALSHGDLPSNVTDDWLGYNFLSKTGFQHIVISSNELKLVHLVAALLKRWLLGTYQGAVRPSHLKYYLDEFTFRFNRRTSASRGKLFYRLVQQAMMVDPAPASILKGPALPFLEKVSNLNLDPIDEDREHNI